MGFFWGRERIGNGKYICSIPERPFYGNIISFVVFLLTRTSDAVSVGRRLVLAETGTVIRGCRYYALDSRFPHPLESLGNA